MRLMFSMLLLSATIVGCSESASTSTSGEGTPSTEQTVNTDAAPATVNEVCPIMGGKVATDGGSADWDGKLVGFCCPGCEPKWEKLTDDEKTEKLAAIAEKAEDGAAHGDHSKHSGHDHS